MRSARIIRLPRREPAPGSLARRPVIDGRGYAATYRHGLVNHCPGCGRSNWIIGRHSAECAFCSTSLPFNEPCAGEPV